MTKHIYITGIEYFVSDSPVAELLHPCETQLPRHIDMSLVAQPQACRTQHVRATRYGHTAKVPCREGAQSVYIYTEVGLSKTAVDSLKDYIGVNAMLRDELDVAAHQVKVERQFSTQLRREIATDHQVINKARNAGFWRRLKWVFTGVQL